MILHEKPTWEAHSASLPGKPSSHEVNSYHHLNPTQNHRWEVASSHHAPLAPLRSLSMAYPILSGLATRPFIPLFWWRTRIYLTWLILESHHSRGQDLVSLHPSSHCDPNCREFYLWSETRLREHSVYSASNRLSPDSSVSGLQNCWSILAPSVCDYLAHSPSPLSHQSFTALFSPWTNRLVLSAHSRLALFQALWFYSRVFRSPLPSLGSFLESCSSIRTLTVAFRFAPTVSWLPPHFHPL